MQFEKMESLFRVKMTFYGIPSPTKLSDGLISRIYSKQLNIYGGHIFQMEYVCTKLMKGKALRKHSLHEKTAASVLLKLFISSNEWFHTTDAP